MKLEDYLNFVVEKWKTTSKKMEDNLKKKKATSKKIEDDIKKIEDDIKKNKMENDLKINKKWKTTSNKMEDEPINQNQPNWL